MDADLWSARMAYLARLGLVDGLGVMLPAREGFSTYLSHNIPTGLGWSSGLAVAVLSRVVQLRTPEQLSPAGLPLADGRTADTLLAAPIVWKDQVVGALAGLSAGRAVGPDELSAFARVAELVGLELAEANAQWRTQKQSQELETRLRSTRDLQRALRQGDPNAVLEQATVQLAEAFGADGVSIMLADEEGYLTVRSSRGLTDAAKRDRKRVGEGISGRVAQSGQAMLLSGRVPEGNDPTIGEALVAPMRSGDRTIGVINVKHRSSQERYGQAQLDALTQVASDIASALLTAEELQRAEEDRKQALALYELSRFTTLGTDPQNDLDSAAAMLAGALRHDAVGIWAVEDRQLRLRASVGYGSVLPSEVALSDADTTLATVLREKRTTRASFAASEDRRPDWAAPGCTNFLVAPIGTVGVLLLGRATEPYTDVDLDFTVTLAEFLTGMLQKHSATNVVERGISAERRRISQEIHDGLAQELTGVVLALEGCQRALEKDPSLLGPQLTKAARDARATLSDVRQYMSALRQSASGTLNLPVTLSRLVDDLRRQSGLQVEMEEGGQQHELEPVVERAVIRIVGEALRNVAQHAGASQAKVSLLYGADEIVVTVEDDGKGFDVDETSISAEHTGHFGVVGMRERAESAGGQLVVRSEPGRGTIVRASIPYMSAAALPAATGTIEDVEQLAAVDEQDAAARGGFLGRLFGR